MSKIMFVSDMHVEVGDYDFFIELLNSNAEEYDVDFILSAGDNGVIDDKFLKSLKFDFYTIYGNHDVLALVDKDRADYYSHWLADGIHIIGDWKIMAWNGIFGFRNGLNRKWFYRSLDDAVRFAFGYKGYEPDIFVSHEVPFYNFDGKVTQDYLAVMNFIVKKVRPKYWLNGHMHMSVPFTYDGVMFYPTKYLRLQTLKDNWAFAILEKRGNNVSVYDIVVGDGKSL